jgi:hypothetical protein
MEMSTVLITSLLRRKSAITARENRPLIRASRSCCQLHRKRESRHSQLSIRLVERDDAFDVAARIENATELIPSKQIVAVCVSEAVPVASAAWQGLVLAKVLAHSLVLPRSRHVPMPNREREFTNSISQALSRVPCSLAKIFPGKRYRN